MLDYCSAVWRRYLERALGGSEERGLHSAQYHTQRGGGWGGSVEPCRTQLCTAWQQKARQGRVAGQVHAADQPPSDSRTQCYTVPHTAPPIATHSHGTALQCRAHQVPPTDGIRCRLLPARCPVEHGVICMVRCQNVFQCRAV